MGGSVSLEDDLENEDKDSRHQPVIGNSSSSPSVSNIHILIYGYIRKHCYMTAPIDIVNICFHFYRWEDLYPQNLFITHKIEQLLQHIPLDDIQMTDNQWNQYQIHPKSHGMCIASKLNNLFISKIFQDKCSKFNIKNAMALIQCGTSYKSLSKNCTAIIFDEHEARNNKYIENAFKLTLPPLPISNPIIQSVEHGNVSYRKYITKSVYSHAEQCIYSRNNAKDIFKLKFTTNKSYTNKIDWKKCAFGAKYCENFEFCLIENDSKLFIMDSTKVGLHNNSGCHIRNNFEILDIESCTSKFISYFNAYHSHCIYSNLCYDYVHNNVYFAIATPAIYCYDLNKHKSKTLKSWYTGDMRRRADPDPEYAVRRTLWMNDRLLYVAKPNKNNKYTVKYYDTRTNDYKWIKDDELSNLLSSVPNSIYLHL